MSEKRFSGNILTIIKFYMFSLIPFKLRRQVLWYLQNTKLWLTLF